MSRSAIMTCSPSPASARARFTENSVFAGAVVSGNNGQAMAANLFGGQKKRGPPSKKYKIVVVLFLILLYDVIVLKRYMMSRAFLETTAGRAHAGILHERSCTGGWNGRSGEKEEVMAEGKRVKLSERTADRLYEMIVEEKRYEPGSKLPNEMNSVMRCRSAHHAAGSDFLSCCTWGSGDPPGQGDVCGGFPCRLGPWT